VTAGLKQQGHKARGLRTVDGDLPAVRVRENQRPDAVTVSALGHLQDGGRSRQDDDETADIVPVKNRKRNGGHRRRILDYPTTGEK
jgi:hypothetical protein